MAMAMAMARRRRFERACFRVWRLFVWLKVFRAVGWRTAVSGVEREVPGCDDGSALVLSCTDVPSKKHARVAAMRSSVPCLGRARYDWLEVCCENKCSLAWESLDDCLKRLRREVCSVFLDAGLKEAGKGI